MWKQRRKHSATNPVSNRYHARRLRFESLERRTLLAGHGDFNGDGFDDLAIGVQDETVDGLASAGAVNIIYGSRRGLTATGNQFWHQNSSGVNGVAEAAANFGSALAVGDFDGDGFDDLAIGVHSQTVNGQEQAGAVNVLYGSANGLRAGTVDQHWTQDSPGVNDTAEANDLFGKSLATGDFDGDGRDDLAIGTSEDVGSVVKAGMVNVLYGSASGLARANDQHFHQNTSGIDEVSETFDLFGSSLAAGDFNGDGRDDLAIGAPYDDVGTIGDAGAVNVIYGSATGLTNSGDQFWHQDSPGVADDAEAYDNFGTALAAGDFNGDGRDDLSIGVSQESVGAIAYAGRVNLLYGSAARLQSSGGTKQINIEALGFTSSTNGFFGYSVAAGDFNGDGRDDLAISAFNEPASGQAGAGAVYVVFGSSTLGLDVTGASRWQQDDVGGTPSTGDNFGRALATGDYDGDNRADLAIGARRDGEPGAAFAGVVNVNYSLGWVDPRKRVWHQGLLSASDGAEADDYFGSALG